MRTRNALERLAAAAPAVELPVDADEDRILARIVASRRRPAPAARWRRTTLVVAGVAVLVAAGATASLELHHGNSPASIGTHGHPDVALTGARIRLAGYHFRTPAGFTASSSCISPPVAGEPRPSIDGFAAAAAADGACVELVYLVAGDWLQAHDPIPDAAAPVDVGQYHALYVAPQASGDESTLYVNLPGADGTRVVYLELRARDVTEQELVAIAASGLPTLPPLGPTQTTGTETSG